MPDKVPAINQTRFSSGNTVRIVYCVALCICMLFPMSISGCSMATRSNSWVYLSAVTDTQESIFIRRQDLVDRGRYVEHPLLEQWKRHLNARERSTFTGWTSKENIMRLAGTRTRPVGHREQFAPQDENAVTYLSSWNSEPLSMYLQASDLGIVSFDSLIPLDYPLINLAQDDFLTVDQRQKTTGTEQELFGGVLNRTTGSERNYMELVFPLFGISFLMCVLMTPVLCSFGARFIAIPIRGSPQQVEVETTIPMQNQDAMASDITWLRDVLV